MTCLPRLLPLIRRACLGTGVLLLAAGCGSPAPEPPQADATVQGKLQYKGKSLLKGTQLNLYSLQHGNIVSAVTEADGGFSFAGPIPPGEYSVYVSGPGANQVPEALQSETSSPARVAIQTGANELSINLE